MNVKLIVALRVMTLLQSVSFFLFRCRCSICECLFDSLMLLEHHKEESEHWSDEGFSDSESESDDWQLDELRHYQLERMIEMEETAFGPDAQIDKKMLLL